MPAIVTGSEYLALPRAPEVWLIDQLLPVSGSMLLFGDPKVGKSYAALQLASCLVQGVEWLGFGIPQAVPVVYIQLDTPRSLWASRVQELEESGHQVSRVHQADRETLDKSPFDILDIEHFTLLQHALAQIRPGAVVVDTLREAHSGDENDSTEMQNVIAHLDAAIKPAAMIFISHARKSNPEADYSLMNNNRGSNYVVGRMDSICQVSKSSVRVVSRALEEHTIKLDRQDDGTWNRQKDQTEAQAFAIYCQLAPDLSQREKARKLHDALPQWKSEAAIRAWMRRL